MVREGRDQDTASHSCDEDLGAIFAHAAQQDFSILAPAERPEAHREDPEKQLPPEIEPAPKLRDGAEEEHENPLPRRNPLRGEETEQTVEREHREKLRQKGLMTELRNTRTAEGE